MSQYDVAHIRVQGQDMIIVPLSSSFGRKSAGEQQRIVGHLQAAAVQAGLKGTVVAVWDAGRGRMGFHAPRLWHSFLRTKGLAWVAANINRKLLIR